MNFVKLLLSALTFLFFFPLELTAKIRILTFHYNSPDFLEYQAKTFSKFFLDDYEVIVFNDAPDYKNEKSIQEVCKKHDLKCVRYEQAWHTTDPLNAQISRQVDTPYKNNYFLFPLKGKYPDLNVLSKNPSVRHCHLIQYALDLFGYEHDDIVVIMDGDVFPVQPISIRELLKDFPLIGVDSEFKDKHYLWVPFIAFHPKRLPNIKDLKFHLGFIDGLLCDTGSYSDQYLKDNPEVSYRLFPRCSDQGFYPWDPSTFLTLGFNNPLEVAKISWPISIEFYVDYHFIHFLGGAADIKNAKKLKSTYDLLNCVLE